MLRHHPWIWVYGLGFRFTVYGLWLMVYGFVVYGLWLYGFWFLVSG